jgi:hypothetical protein
MKSTKVLIISIFLLFTSHLFGQVINIEKKRIITDTTGISGNIGVNFSSAKTTRTFTIFSFNGHLQYKTEKNLFLLLGNVDWLKAGDAKFDNRGFAHFRYNYKVNPVVRLEAFTQVQFNRLLKIDQRNLNGLGIRLKLSELERAKFYFGLAYMNEYEVLEEPAEINTDHRASSYLTFTLIPETTVTLSNTTYIQPKLDDLEDYRLNNDTNLSFQITEHLKFVAVLNFLYDANPPIDVPNLVYTVKNGLTYGF